MWYHYLTVRINSVNDASKIENFSEIRSSNSRVGRAHLWTSGVKYLRMYCTDFRNLFTIWKGFGCRWWNIGYLIFRYLTGRCHGKQFCENGKLRTLLLWHSETECTNALYMHDLIAPLMPLYRVNFGEDRSSSFGVSAENRLTDGNCAVCSRRGSIANNRSCYLYCICKYCTWHNAPRLWPSDVRSIGSFSMLDLSRDVAMATK